MKITKIAQYIVISIGLLIPLSIAFANTAEFSLSPTNPNDTQESWLVYTIAPGTTLEDSVTISNISDETITLKLYPADTETSTTEDEFALKSNTVEMSTIGKWVSLNTESITLGPKEKKVVNFTLTIPSGTAEQEYKGGIVAELEAKNDTTTTGTESTIVQIASRVGLRLYATVKEAPVTDVDTDTGATKSNSNSAFIIIGIVIVITLVGLLFSQKTKRKPKK